MAPVIGYPKLDENDVKKFLFSGTHCGEKILNSNMKTFVFNRRNDGHYCIDLHKTWNHLLLAARILAGIENPSDICAISSSAISTRAVLKFALFTKSSSITGKYTPGTLTNQAQKNFREPRILVVSDPILDHQAITESSSVGIPVIALCNTGCPLNNIDVVIPCNNKGPFAVGLIWWMLAREILRFKRIIDRRNSWDIMPDMFFPREQDQEEKETPAPVEVTKPLLSHVVDKNADLASDRFTIQDEPPSPFYDRAGSDIHELRVSLHTL